MLHTCSGVARNPRRLMPPTSARLRASIESERLSQGTRVLDVSSAESDDGRQGYQSFH